MSKITSIAELEALPVGAVCATNGGPVQHLGDGDFYTTGDEAIYEARDVIQWLPITVLRADDESPLHMVRCCVAACTTTAPLAPGSTLICPEHGDEHHDIATKGDRS